MEEKEQLMIQIDNVSKVYKLGEIGGTTLRESFQRLFAKILHKEDPTKKIGAKNYNKGEKFLALDNINLTIKKGERVGIIGHNGTGKSTLLKLICRVTAPTTGEIGLNGRITSMLEVGTGFHPELTGRENIYVNGAILGMTKKEIDEVIEDIIEFSEVREFIDTPVKRYSSGMYVKLAFSVAAHLKSEIMIMDEVLAVGDMAFQNKCLNKMRSVSEDEGRTILYVSHNMNTIRQLCDRVVVLDHGQLVFDGNAEIAINKYLNLRSTDEVVYDLEQFARNKNYCTGYVKMIKSEILGSSNTLEYGHSLKFNLSYYCNKSFDVLLFKFSVYRLNGIPVETFVYSENSVEIGKYVDTFVVNTSNLVPDKYYLRAVVYQVNSNSLRYNHDYVENALFFNIVNNDMNNGVINSWLKDLCGNLNNGNIEKIKGVYKNDE